MAKTSKTAKPVKKKVTKVAKAAKLAKPAPNKTPKKAALPQKKGEDTGSAQSQIKFFSERIEELVVHLRTHPKDFDSKRGLLMLIGKRRRMLNYLARSNQASYQKIAAALKLAKAKQ